MENNILRSFMLNNKLASVSATILPDSTLATDGFNCAVYHFDLCGNLIGCTNTAHPYIRVRKIDSGYTAINRCENRIYFLNDCFVVQDFIDLRASSQNGCGRNGGVLTDSNLVEIGTEFFVSGAFPENAYLFDTNGRKFTRLCQTNTNEYLTDFLYISDNLFAMSSIQGKNRIITVSENQNTFSGILNSAYNLRMLIHYENAIYGLFGRCYLQNQIIKIYENGIFRLP